MELAGTNLWRPSEELTISSFPGTAASTAGRPRLVFLLDDAAGLPSGFADADSAVVDAFR